jgi:CheY-like chemotaxis protein
MDPASRPGAFIGSGTFPPVGVSSGDAWRFAEGHGREHRFATFNLDGFVMAVILIVEDEVFIRQNAEWMIGDLGHDVLLAGDVERALFHLCDAAHIDALFVDIRLAEVASGGYEVADKAVEQHPRLRVLYTSGSPLTLAMTSRFVPGGRFLNKPYSPGQLESAVTELLC